MKKMVSILAISLISSTAILNPSLLTKLAFNKVNKLNDNYFFKSISPKQRYNKTEVKLDFIDYGALGFNSFEDFENQNQVFTLPNCEIRSKIGNNNWSTYFTEWNKGFFIQSLLGFMNNDWHTLTFIEWTSNNEYRHTLARILFKLFDDEVENKIEIDILSELQNQNRTEKISNLVDI